MTKGCYTVIRIKINILSQTKPTGKPTGENILFFNIPFFFLTFRREASLCY
jgi:hypothetical protein